MDPFDAGGSRIPKMSLLVNPCRDKLLLKRGKPRLFNIIDLLRVCRIVFLLELLKGLIVRLFGR